MAKREKLILKMIQAKKGQSSLEFLMIVGIVSVVLMTSLVVLLNFARGSTDEIVMNQIDTIGNTITENAEMLLIYGYPARRTVEFSFPANVRNMTLTGDHILHFEVSLTGRTTYMGYHSNVNISADFDERDFMVGERQFLMRVSEDEDKIIIERW